MARYEPSDDGKVIEGRTVFFLRPGRVPQVQEDAGRSARNATVEGDEAGDGAAPSPAGDRAAPARPGSAPERRGPRTTLAPQPAVDRAATPSAKASFSASHFETDKAFPLPEARALLLGLVSFAKSQPRRSLLVIGHTDGTGTPSHNLALSEERAEAIAAALRGDVAGWMKFYQGTGQSKKWGMREDQHLLHALGHYGRAAGGPHSEELSRAVSSYQKKQGLPVDGLMGPRSREALVREYFAAHGRVPASMQIATLGCGQFHPVKPVKGACEENRRVDVLAFEPGKPLPAPALCEKSRHPGCTVYDAWMKEVTGSIDPREVVAPPPMVIIEGPQSLIVGEEARYSTSGQCVRWSVRVASGETVSDCAADPRFSVSDDGLSIKAVPGQWNRRQVTVAAGESERSGISVGMKPFVLADSWTFRAPPAAHRPGEGDDFTAGDMTLAEYEQMGLMFKLDCGPGGLARESDDFLIATFQKMARDLFTSGELNANTDAMIARFRRNLKGDWKANTYSNDVLTRHARNHASTRRFVGNLARALSESLSVAGGDIGRVGQFKEKINSPVYGTTSDLLGGLTIAINDTWAYEVRVVDCVLTGERTFRAKLSIVIYDHFGLNRSDLDPTPISALGGFRAWYLLQHVRGYQPFVTVLSFEELVEGAF